MKSSILREDERFDTVREYINRGIKRYENNNAFTLKTKKEDKIEYTNVTYKEFGEEIKNLGTKLIDMGLENKKIAIIGKNSYEWVVSYISILCGVGAAVPLDKGLQESELIESLKRSKADAVIFEDKYIEIMKKIEKENIANINHFICMNSNTEYIAVRELIDEGKKLIENGDEKFINHKIIPDEMATLIFTSGTTSKSKAVILTHKNIASNIYQMNCAETILSTDVNLAFLPLHHAFGSTGIILFLSHGVTNVFCDGLKYIQKNLQEYKVTTFICVPLLLENMYKKIMKQIEKQNKTKIIKIAIIISNILLKFNIDIRKKLFKQILDQLGGNLRFIVSGASAIDKKVAKGFNDFGILTIQGYGLTEASPVVAAENENGIKYGSIGRALPEIEVKIDNKNEKGIGEIVIKGPNIMQGYYEMEEETNSVLKDGWFYTGDLGYKDKDEFIFITGRKKNVIVLKNGKNVYPEELEQLINKLPYVDENMVFGKEKDDDLLVSVKVVYNKDYVKEKYPELNQEELKDIIWSDIKKINKTLPKYKYIKNLIVTDEPMIKTTTAKIKRFEEIKKENK